MATNEEIQELEKESEAAADAADILMKSDIQTLLTNVQNIQNLKPEMVDEKTFDAVVNVVENATRENLAVATVKENIENLGQSAVALAKQMAQLATVG